MMAERVNHLARSFLLLAAVLGVVLACEGQRDATPPQQSPPSFRLQGRAILKDRPLHAGTHVFLGGTSHSVFTNSQGAYAFEGLKSGDYELIAEKIGYGEVIRQITVPADSDSVVELPLLTLTPLTVETQPTTPTLTVATPSPTPAVTPIVAPTAAQPVRGTRTISGQVLVLDEQGNLTIDFPAITVFIDELGLSSTLMPDGSFSFQQLPARELVVTAQGQGYRLEAPARVDLRTNARANVVLRVQAVPPAVSQAQGDVVGTILIPEGVEPPDSIRVSLAGTQFSGVTNGQGVFQFNGVPEGSYTLVVEAEGFAAMRLPGVEVVAGDAADLGQLLLEPEVNPPTVVTTTPRDGARRVLIQARTPVLVRFSEPMDPRTVKDAFTILPEVDYQIFFGNEHPRSNDSTLFVEILGESPDRFPRFGTTYTAVISSSATDVDGTPMEDDYEFEFTTGGPSVVETYPANGARNVGVDLNRSVRFVLNDQINVRDRVEEYVKIRPELGAAPSFYVSNDPYSGWTEIRIFAIWQPETTYRVTLERGLESVDEQRYENLPYSFSFTTAALKPLVPLAIEPRRRVRPTDRIDRR